ncbi:MAG: twin-arginine translocation signal domain-containing protein, partial [Akkermansiaceae bacterium]
MFEITRRHFLSKLSTGIGGAALASMLPQRASGANALAEKLLRDHAPKAKRVIYLF